MARFDFAHETETGFSIDKGDHSVLLILTDHTVAFPVADDRVSWLRWDWHPEYQHLCGAFNPLRLGVARKLIMQSAAVNLSHYARLGPNHAPLFPQ